MGRLMRTAMKTFRCIHCGLVYSHDAWTELATVRTLARDEVHAHVVQWPSNATIEVRACRSCQKPMARVTHAM